jgi:hypothetical protein
MLPPGSESGLACKAGGDCLRKIIFALSTRRSKASSTRAGGRRLYRTAVLHWRCLGLEVGLQSVCKHPGSAFPRRISCDANGSGQSRVGGNYTFLEGAFNVAEFDFLSAILLTNEPRAVHDGGNASQIFARAFSVQD